MDINQLLLYETIRFFIGPMMKFHLRLKIEGQENVPDNGAAVIACNHRSTMDPIILGYSVRNRYISFGAAAWSYKVPVYGHFHRAIGAFPLTLTGGEKSGDELNRGLELLNEGEIVGIFPEGGETIFDPGKVEKITPFKTGFARLALEARVPVIPVAIIGSGERRLPTVPGPVVEKVVKHPKSEKGYSSVIYKRARCRIGLPLDLGDLYDNPINKKLLDLVTSKVRQIVMKLYNGEDLERFMTGEIPFDFAYERIGGRTKKLL
ncbi:MAG: 1-acyl-sn-glycerol-3-phosphate acyltransferase [Actinobacteria bacterium]|nr:1-acyl-sn-glycerol-3-phosphate acyltransferase [Actinomycetota bacterium]